MTQLTVFGLQLRDFYILVTSFFFKMCINIVLKLFTILVLQEYWVLTESRILLKPVLGEVRIIALSISSHEQTRVPTEIQKQNSMIFP